MKKSTIIYFFLIVLSLTLLFFGCSKSKKEDTNNKADTPKKHTINKQEKKQEDKHAMKDFKDYKLSQEKIDGLIKSFDEIKKEKIFNFDDNSKIQEFTKILTANNKVNSIAKKYGFSSSQELFFALSKVFYVYSYIKLLDSKQKAEKQFKANKKNMQKNLNSPNIPSQLKDQLKKQMEKLDYPLKALDKQLKEMKENITDEEINLIKKNKNELNKFLNL